MRTHFTPLNQSFLLTAIPFSFFLFSAEHFLKNNGHLVISIKANCIDSTAPADVVFASEVKKLQEGSFKPHEQLTLEPYERDHAMVVYVFFFYLLSLFEERRTNFDFFLFF